MDRIRGLTAHRLHEPWHILGVAGGQVLLHHHPNGPGGGVLRNGPGQRKSDAGRAQGESQTDATVNPATFRSFRDGHLVASVVGHGLCQRGPARPLKELASAEHSVGQKRCRTPPNKRDTSAARGLSPAGRLRALRHHVQPDAPHLRLGPPSRHADGEFSVRVDLRRPFGDQEELLTHVAVGGVEAEAVVAHP